MIRNIPSLQPPRLKPKQEIFWKENLPAAIAFHAANHGFQGKQRNINVYFSMFSIDALWNNYYIIVIMLAAGPLCNKRLLDVRLFPRSRKRQREIARFQNHGRAQVYPKGRKEEVQQTSMSRCRSICDREGVRRGRREGRMAYLQYIPHNLGSMGWEAYYSLFLHLKAVITEYISMQCSSPNQNAISNKQP